MANLDVFQADGFSMHELTATFNKQPHQPMRLGELRLFQESGVRTASVDIESQDGRLSLIQTSPRGGVAADPLGGKKRKLRTFKAFHLERDSKVYADEVQGIRAYGSMTELQQVQDLVNERMAELRPMHEVTLEYHRMNAIRGLLLDADGSSLYNLFTEFDVTQQTHQFTFTNADLDVRNTIVAAMRKSEDEMGGSVVSRYIGLCSPEWFDAFISHANVKKSYESQEGQMLRDDLRRGFRYGGVDWEEYRGSVPKPDSVGGGSATFIDANCAYLIPVANPSIFIVRFAPADYEETVNTVGLPLYAKQVADPSGLNKYRLINTQSNPIALNLRPRAVVKLTKN